MNTPNIFNNTLKQSIFISINIHFYLNHDEMKYKFWGFFINLSEHN